MQLAEGKTYKTAEGETVKIDKKLSDDRYQGKWVDPKNKGLLNVVAVWYSDGRWARYEGDRERCPCIHDLKE